MIIFPTRAKSKLPADLCFPLGAEAISSRFQDVPQVDQLTISFWWYNRSFNSFTPDGFRDVIQVGYSYRRSTQYQPLSDPLHHYDQPNWSITLAAVYRSEKRLLVEALEGQAFARMHQWLVANATLIGQETSVAIKVLWHPDRELLAFEECNRFETIRL